MDALIQRAIELPWGYIMFTLLIRFVGVFIVLAILMAAMYLLGFVVSRVVAKQEAKKADRQKAINLAAEPEREADEEEIIAAIGAALAMAIEAQRVSPAVPEQSGISAGESAGAWALAGRTSQMNMRIQGGAYRRS